MSQQPDLFGAAPDTARPHKAVNVPRTSVLAYQEQKPTERATAVTAWLSACGQVPTSAELAQWRWTTQGHRGDVGLDCLLYTRRGLSDARKLGLVEHAGQRKCAMSGRQCVLWRVRTR